MGDGKWLKYKNGNKMYRSKSHNLGNRTKQMELMLWSNRFTCYESKISPNTSQTFEVSLAAFFLQFELIK